MLSKLIVLILTAGATACVLLVFRQERIDLAHETAAIHMRLGQHERSEWRIRMLLDENTSVQQVAILAERYAREHNLSLVPFASASFQGGEVILPDPSNASHPLPIQVPPGETTAPEPSRITPISNSSRTSGGTGHQP